MSNTAVDIFALYKIIKALTVPYDEMEAYKLGIIDNKGDLLKKPVSPEEKKAYNHFNRFVVNIKRIMSKFGLRSRISTFAAALFLLKECREELTDEQILDEICTNIKNLAAEDFKEYDMLQEEITNVTGPAVAGTGDTGVTWARHRYKVGCKGEKRRHGRCINGVAYLKRAARKRNEAK